MAVSNKIPHRLDLVVDFVNTLDVEEETDALATPDGLGRWLGEKALLEPAAGSLGETERLRAIELREALRELLLEHNGGPADTRAAQVLEDVARGGDESKGAGRRGDQDPEFHRETSLRPSRADRFVERRP